MASLNLIWLIIIFIVSAAVIWIAGISLTKTTDSLDTRFKIGDALGGLILLGITGSLPEIAITVSAALAGHLPVIIGNLLGGIAIQTLIIIFFDFAVKGKRPLSYLAGTPLLFFESLMVIFIILLTLLGALVPIKAPILHLNVFSIFIVVGWLGSLFFINKARKMKRFLKTASDAQPGRLHHERRAVENHPFYAKKSNLFVIGIFALAALATLIAGVLVERSGTAIAMKFGISSGIFAATFMAIASSLPEISTGLESIFIGDNQLAISDIFGGNAFMPVLFIVADLLAQKSVLSFAGHADIVFIILGITMTLIYGLAFEFKPKKRYFRLGIDSILQIIVYALGLWSLSFIK